ncbi:amino acid permease [Pectinatus brassicae]|uniref:L-asparagine transporter-like permease n=1 Tax=Pectinatus brassicae TaxID=862415 RepID=A0A840URQ3_9FIRM|nr:amino acid permease [Pectinatus brassicae]MBB5335225.1 L-asparagine transporter-like permease [Pectinatus brassicae]
MKEEKNLQRGLKERHIQMIALGCAIGTGLFYGSASTIKMVGPAVMLSYLIGGIFIYFVVRALGEMAVYNPVSGSFSTYAYDYWGEFPGFLSGWNYWFNYVAVSMVEVSVVGIYMQHWFPGLPMWVSGLILFILVNIINLVNVKSFGEIEFWGAIIKVAAILLMIIFGLAIIFFGVGNNQPLGLHNLYANGGFFPQGFDGMMLSFVVVIFAFGGTELIGITAGEAENPQKTIPKAIDLIIGRILIFYVGAMFVLVTLYPWDKVGMNGSPFVEIFSAIGFSEAASILNVIVLTAVFSAYNSCLYSNARMLHGLALQNNAPAFLKKVSKDGVPRAAVLFSSLFVGIVVIITYLAPKEVFNYVMSIATIAALINWIMILYTQIKFRQKIGINADKLTYKMPFFPVLNYIGIVFFLSIAITMVIMPDYRLAVYLCPIWIFIIYIGYRLKKSK